VFPNKYPITDLHEVIIHSPDDSSDIEKLPVDQVTKILTAYRDRYRAHESNGQVIIFCNHGFHAGASLKHPHSQLVVVPKQISLDALSREPVANIIEESEAFVVYCPEFSQWPYETWIVPKDGGIRYGDTPDGELSKLAHMLQYTLQRIERVFLRSKVTAADRTTQFVYNYYIYPGEQWYLRIIPRFIHRAGFELGTGLNVNIVDPVDAAKELKSIQAVPVK
jgi:UDPglucose--hexose-1-phosphate uridylyltransferase